jgi:hypothetical protein
VTKHGTIVGPLMTELVGFKELTPYKGGWCGNEVFAGAFSAEIRDQARDPRWRSATSSKNSATAATSSSIS